MKLEIFVDASSSDDGVARYGYIIRQHTTTLAEGFGYYPGNFTSTPAEHIAADLAYRVVKLFARRLKVKIDKITLFTDVEDIVKEERRPQSLKALYHYNGFTERYRIPVEYRWIPSKDNIADRLVSDPEKRRKEMYFRSLREKEGEDGKGSA